MVQRGSESTSESRSQGEIEATNETKKLGANLASNLILVVSEKVNQVTPEFNISAKKLSGPALYTSPR